MAKKPPKQSPLEHNLNQGPISFTPRKAKPKPKTYVAGVTDFPKPVAKPKAPKPSPFETQLNHSPFPLLTDGPLKPKSTVVKPKPVVRSVVKPKPVVKTSPAVRPVKTTVLPQSHPAQPSSAQPVQSVAPAAKVAPVPRATAAVKPKPLPPTNDRPQRKQPRAVTSARPVRAPAPPPSAAQEVAGLLAPQYGVLTAQEKQREAALAQFSTAIINQLKGVPGQVQGDYSVAQNAINGYAQTAATGLANANPNGSAQALMQAIGAPQAQQDQIAQQNADVFGGGAGVLYDRNGAIPASQTAADQAGALLYARSLPAIQGLASMQGMRQFQQQDAVARQQLAAQAPELIQKVQASRADNALKQQALDQNAQALGLKTQQQQFSNGVEIARLRQTDRRIRQTDIKISQSAAKYNATQSVKANKIDVGVSKGMTDGFAHNSSGKVIYVNGQPLKFNPKTSSVTSKGPKVPTGSQINTLVSNWKNGKVQNVNVLQPEPDQNGNPVYRSVSTQTGQIGFGQAYRRLRAMHLSDKQARQYLSTAWMRGEQGRAWVTNEEQAVLRKAGVPTRARVVNGHGILSLQQAHALQKAGRLPAGQQTSDGYFVIAQTY